MNHEKVSIIIPVYNVESYLAECLESAVNQDHDNIEIIAINDGSTDGSLSILEKFRETHKNIKIYTIENHGQSIARNMGIKASTGEYILFLDSDDYIEKHTISHCIKKIKNHQADIIFFSASSFCDGVDAKIAESFNYERPATLLNHTIPANDFFCQSLKLNSYIVSPCLYMYKKNKFDNINFHPGIVHEDNLFTTRILLENKNTNVTCIPDMLFNRRIRPESTMTQKKQAKHVQGYMTVAEELLKLITTNENSDTDKALSLFIQNIATSSLNACRTCLLYTSDAADE